MGNIGPTEILLILLILGAGVLLVIGVIVAIVMATRRR